MRKDQYIQWLQDRGTKSFSNYISKTQRIENAYGDIDTHYDKDKCQSLLDIFNYSKQDIKDKLQPKHSLPITPISDKDLCQSYYEGTSDFCTKIRTYMKFRASTDSKEIQAPLTTPAKKRELPMKNPAPLNQIFYGPPGTGKTFNTIEAALDILEPNHGITDREEVKKRFEEWKKKGHVEFVTFHQSFSYENFIEGIRPVISDDSDENTESEYTGQIRYDIQSGIFKELCNKASSKTIIGTHDDIDISNKRIWKMSLGNARTATSYVYDICVEKNILLLGCGQGMDFSDCKTQEDIFEVFAKNGDPQKPNAYPPFALAYFMFTMKKGDLVVISEGNTHFRAIGEVTGDYEQKHFEGCAYDQSRAVRWLQIYEPSQQAEQLMNARRFSQMSLYRLHLDNQEQNNLKNLFTNENKGDEKKPYVLIIDEINRGNISSIFGELITLIEPSKRQGNKEELTARLPYSKTLITVPNNLYLIGTMNTADRSLTGLDIALRRRFTFKEMPPRPDLLEDMLLADTEIRLADILYAMNQRIEALLDKDHCIGHAYFMDLQKGFKLEELAQIFQQNIIPLLQEYFFEDWQKIQFILNDHRKKDDHKFIIKRSIDTNCIDEGMRSHIRTDSWDIYDEAYEIWEAFTGIVDPSQRTAASSKTQESAEDLKHKSSTISNSEITAILHSRC